MLTHVARRLASLLLTLAACSVVVFLVLEVLPGDVAEVMLGTEAPRGHAGGAQGASLASTGRRWNAIWPGSAARWPAISA